MPLPDSKTRPKSCFQAAEKTDALWVIKNFGFRLISLNFVTIRLAKIPRWRASAAKKAFQQLKLVKWKTALLRDTIGL